MWEKLLAAAALVAAALFREWLKHSKEAKINAKTIDQAPDTDVDEWADVVRRMRELEGETYTESEDGL